MVEFIMSKNSETIALRQSMLDRMLTDFEKGRDPAYIIGFYSSIIKQLASDRGDTFLDTAQILKTNTKA